MRKNLLVFTLLMFGFSLSYAQTVQDCHDFIRTNIESSPAFDNYINKIYFGQGLTKTDANKYTGKYLTDEEYKNLFVYSNQVYLDKRKIDMAFMVCRSFDLRGIRKVSTVKTNSNNVDYYYVIVTLANNYKGYKYSTTGPIEEISELKIGVRTDDVTANKIKKAIIALSKLSGNTNVVDGDDMF